MGRPLYDAHTKFGSRLESPPISLAALLKTLSAFAHGGFGALPARPGPVPNWVDHRTEFGGRSPCLLGVELDDELLLHLGVDDGASRQRVHQDLHLGRDGLEP